MPNKLNLAEMAQGAFVEQFHREFELDMPIIS
jgi:hypothetical protein